MSNELEVIKPEPVALVRQPDIAGMLQAVIDKGVSAENVAAVEQLVKLFEHLEAKKAEKEFVAAFVQMQSEMKRVKATKAVLAKDQSVKYRVAPPEEIDEQARPIYQKFGFSLGFEEAPERQGKIGKTCILQHISGHARRNNYYVRVGSGPPGATESQADGSAHSYAKRGAMCDALNIVIDHAGEDDDPRNEGTDIGPVKGQELKTRLQNIGADQAAFLKFAGATSFETISSVRLESIEEMLAKKERLYMQKLGAKA